MKRCKRFWALLLSVCMLVAIMPIQELEARTAMVETLQNVELFCDDFDSYSTLETTTEKISAMKANGWRQVSNAGANWATSGAYVIPYSNPYNLALNNHAEAAEWSDYIVEADITLLSGSTVSGNAAVGVSGRIPSTADATSHATGYDLTVLYDASKTSKATMRLQCDGTTLQNDSTTASVAIPYPTEDVPFKLAMEFEGTVIKGYLNGELKLTYDTADDEVRYEAGYAGVRRKAAKGHNTSFDNFSVYAKETVTQEKGVLYSLNGVALTEGNLQGTDNTCFYYDTFSVEEGYMAAKGSATGANANPATYNATEGYVEVGNLANHQRTTFNGITNASTLKNYTISGDFVFVYTGDNNWSGGVGANCTAKGVGYEFTVYNGKIRLRNRTSGSGVLFQGDAISDYFPSYEQGDVVGLSLSCVTNADGTVSLLGTMTHENVEKFVCMYTDSDTTKCVEGVPALIGYNQSAEPVCTVDNLLIQGINQSIAEEAIEKFGFVSNMILNIGGDDSQRNFNWQTMLDFDCNLQYGLKSEMVEGRFPETYIEVEADKNIETVCGAISHKATISELADNTEYVYRIVTGNVASAIYSFSTGDLSDGYMFSFMGDPQVGRTDVENDELGWEATLETLKANFDVDFMISLGDQVHTNTADNYGKFVSEQLTGLTTATIVGNHDNSAMQKDYFNMPNESEEYGLTKAGGNYWFVYDNTLFLCLNSNNASAEEHIAFMEEAIAQNPDVIWKTVSMHHCIYSVSDHHREDDVLALREALVPAFNDLGIDVVLTGHDHCYTRTYIMDGFEPVDENGVQSSAVNPNGVLYITANSASGNKYNPVRITNDYVAVTEQSNRRTFATVNVTDTSYSIITYYADTLEIMDKFTIYKGTDISADVNGNGSIDANDMLEMRKILVSASPVEFYDINKDGMCNVLDLVWLKKYLDR